MKEVTEWDNNPREMWVWNKEDASDKVVRKVVHILNVEPYYFPIMTVNKNNSHTSTYRYCAEIEAIQKEVKEELGEQTQNLAKRICELQSDLAREKSKNERITERLEKDQVFKEVQINY